MKALIPMVIADEYKHVAYGLVRVLGISGFNNNSGAGADRFLQLHEKFPAALTAGDVPSFKSLYFPAGTTSVYARDIFGDDGLPLDELTAAVSSTEVDYTAVTNTGLDLTLEVESNHLVTSATTVVGDLTTGVDELEVWLAAAFAAKQLRRIDFKNNSGVDAYVRVVARDAVPGLGTELTKLVIPSPSATNGVPKVPNGATRSFFFGPGGGQFQEQVVGTGIFKGCRVYGTTSATDILAVLGTQPYNIRAVYEA